MLEYEPDLPCVSWLVTLRGGLMPDLQSSVSVPISRCRKLRCRFRAVYGSRIRNDGNHFTFQCSELTDNLRLSVCRILYTSLKPKHTVFSRLIQIDFAANTYHSHQFQWWQQAKHFLLIYYFEILLIFILTDERNSYVLLQRKRLNGTETWTWKPGVTSMSKWNNGFLFTL